MNNYFIIFFTITSVLFFLSVNTNLYPQDYSKLKVNETITVPYEPYEWEIASPQSLGIDSEKINAFLQKTQEWENVGSILVIKDDKIIIEKYFHGRDKYSAFNVFSITKSITSALIGIAIKKQLISSEDEIMMDYFPEYNDKINDQRKNKITLKHLLTMTGGMNPEEWWDPDIEFALTKAPVEKNPGEKFLYYNALPMFLSAILTKTSGLTIKEFAEKELFQPLGIICANWVKEGEYYSGRSNTYFTPRDIARLGSLYLNKGIIDGKQIIDSSWIEKTFNNYAESDKGFFLTGHSYNQTGYGYLWWISEADDITYYSAYGAGDQFVNINPEQNTIVVISQYYKDTWLEVKEDVDMVSELLSIIHN